MGVTIRLTLAAETTGPMWVTGTMSFMPRTAMTLSLGVMGMICSTVTQGLIRCLARAAMTILSAAQEMTCLPAAWGMTCLKAVRATILTGSESATARISSLITKEVT